MVLLESLNGLLGTCAYQFSLKGIDGRMYSLDDFRDAKALVIVFMCNHCPYVQAVWPKLVALQEKYREVQFVGINPNIGNKDYSEETSEKMKEYAERFNMNFPYLVDENQETAKKYKAQCTPDIYVYDSERKLAYHGRVDDARPEKGEATTHDLDDALDALLKGDMPKKQQFPCMGCSIKWYN